MSKLNAANAAAAAFIVALQRESNERHGNRVPLTQKVVDHAEARVTALKCEHLDLDPGMAEVLDQAVANLREAFVLS